MPWTSTLGVAVSFALDVTLGEPPERLHPVKIFGDLVARFDRDWRRPYLVGVLVAVFLPLLAASTVAGAVYVASEVHPVFGSLLAAVALFSSTSLRRLVETASEIIDESGDDTESARRHLPRLVGRDPRDLSPDEIRSAAVESVSENLADGLVAPLLGFVALAPFSLPLGAGAAAWVKSVNTLDSMLGYPSKPVGRASAYLDDVVIWVPARLTTFVIAAVSLRPSSAFRARRWKSRTQSPNSGWPMSTLSEALDVRLSKRGEYVLNPGAEFPTEETARRGIRLVAAAGVVSYLVAGVVTWL